MKVFGKVNWAIMKVFWFACIALFAAMCVVMSIRVFGRILGGGLTWSEEFGRYGQVILVNLGAALVMHEDSHISMNLLEELLHGVPRKILKVIQYLFMIAYGGVILYLSPATLELASKSVSASMQIPMTFVYVVYPIMGVAIIIHCVYLICKLFAGEKEASEA